MQSPTPRLPLDPGPRPLYRARTRLGCPGIVLVAGAAALAFFFIYTILAPRLLDQARTISLPAALGLGRPTPAEATPVLVGAALGTPEASPTPIAPSPTTVPTAEPATPTPQPEYVAIANTGGDNVALRADPRPDGLRLLLLPPRTVLLVVGADVITDGKLWRNVETTQDTPITGWMLAQYLTTSSPP